MKMNQSKFSMPSLDRLKLMMTPTTLKIHFIWICDPTMPSTWRARNETWGNWTTCFAQQIKRSSTSTNRIANHRYNYNLCFKVEHDYIIIWYNLPKKKSSSSIIVGWFATIALTRIKWKNTCNISVIICHNLNGMCIAHKIPCNLHVLKWRFNMIANILWALAWL
jgi:hypothetical protein